MCETLAMRICQTLEYAITAHCHHFWWRESQESCFLSRSLPPLWPFSITPSLLLCLLYSAILPSFLFLPGVLCFFASSLQLHHFLSAPLLPISPSCCLVPDIPPLWPPLPPARWLSLIVTFFFFSSVLPSPVPFHVTLHHANSYLFVTFRLLLGIHYPLCDLRPCLPFVSCVSSSRHDSYLPFIAGLTSRILYSMGRCIRVYLVLICPRLKLWGIYIDLILKINKEKSKKKCNLQQIYF